MNEGLSVLFISTWPSGSGLSAATVHPHLRVLASDDRVSVVHYVSMEPEEPIRVLEMDGVRHRPVFDEARGGLLGKAINQRARMNAVVAMADAMRPDLVICRGAPAGAFGVKLNGAYGIPFVVESFEPHAEYMRSAGLWSKLDPRYVVQKRWEEQSKRLAEKLITVSDAYARHLIEEEGLPATNVLTVPCWVDEASFRFDRDARKALRKELGLEDAIVCIYVGKFGGLYYEEEAVHALNVVAQEIGDRFFLLILSPDPEEKVSSLFRSSERLSQRIWIGSASHEAVTNYLSAADFAISLHRSSEWSLAFSPIKHAEYWACGLPTLIPEGVGDEAQWIEREGLGATMNVADEDSVQAATKSLLEILEQEDHRNRIRDSALKQRGKDRLVSTYDMMLSEQQSRFTGAMN